MAKENNLPETAFVSAVLPTEDRNDGHTNTTSNSASDNTGFRDRAGGSGGGMVAGIGVVGVKRKTGSAVSTSSYDAASDSDAASLHYITPYDHTGEHCDSNSRVIAIVTMMIALTPPPLSALSIRILVPLSLSSLHSTIILSTLTYALAHSTPEGVPYPLVHPHGGSGPLRARHPRGHPRTLCTGKDICVCV